ncbi:MAG: tyrosine-type recombinase/integrase [Chloroflexi bacterium]|nr:tyrosine-type recombinase/integrase [Chloroflexota bacterium]
MVTAVGCSGLVRAFRLALSVEGLKPKTVSDYVREVERIATFLDGQPFDSVTSTDIRAHVADLGARRSAKTVHEAQLALRRFFRFLVQEGEIGSDPTRDVKPVRYRVVPQPIYTDDEIKRLLKACDLQTLNGVRNRAMVTVLFDTGVRAGELVSMQIPDWDRRSVRVDGKTGVRDVPLGVASIQAVERYVRRWKLADGPLWQGKKGPLTGSGVLQLIQRLCERSAVRDKGVHAFRRAAAAQMKRSGMNDSDILEVMGWSSIAMLRRYTAGVAQELAQLAHIRHSPADALR